MYIALTETSEQAWLVLRVPIYSSTMLRKQTKNGSKIFEYNDTQFYVLPKCRPMQHYWLATGTSTRRPFYSCITHVQQRIDHPTSLTAAYLGPRFWSCHMHKHNSSGPTPAVLRRLFMPCGIAEHQLLSVPQNNTTWLTDKQRGDTHPRLVQYGRQCRDHILIYNWQIAWEHRAPILISETENCDIIAELSPHIADSQE